MECISGRGRKGNESLMVAGVRAWVGCIKDEQLYYLCIGVSSCSANQR
jgi:hypothetical protein